MTELRRAGFLTASLILLLSGIGPVEASAQQVDSLPQLTPGDYVPEEITGFERTSLSDLNETDRSTLEGVRSGTKSYWSRPGLSLSGPVTAFDVSVDVFRFDSPANARALVEEDFRRMGGFGRDTVAGLPVVTSELLHEGARSSSYDAWIGYRQGTLAVRVSASKVVSEPSVSETDVWDAAERAFEALVRRASSP